MEDGLSAFGDAKRASDRARQMESRRLAGIADTLLDKSMTALHDGDQTRARQYVAQASRLPWDEHEDWHPAVLQAGMVLFLDMTDDFEADQQHDLRWLDAALRARAQLPDGAAAEITRVLAVVAQDYELTRREAARVGEAIPAGYVMPELAGGDLSPTSDEAVIEAAVWRNILAANEFHQESLHRG